MQTAFKEGRLKPGLSVEQKSKRPLINNKVNSNAFVRSKISSVHFQEVLTAKYAEMYLDLPWTERLDCTNAPLVVNETALPANDDDTLADNDFKREMLL